MTNFYSLINTLLGHDKNVALSSKKLNFIGNNVATDGITVHMTHKIHILCMIWAWMLFLPVGIFIARYYKETWSKVRFNRRHLWFIVNPSSYSQQNVQTLK